MKTAQRRSLRSAGTSGTGGDEPVAGPSTQQSQMPGNTASQLHSQLSQVHITDEGSSDEPEADETSYGDMHRLVLQGLLAAGYLDAKGVKKLFQESCKQLNCKVNAEEHQSPTFIQKVVREINVKIKAFEMVIRSATCEITGGKFYVLLVSLEKQVMKHQTYFTKAELEFFQKILDTMLRKHANFAMSMTECINIGGDMNIRGFSKADCEDFMSRMMSLQYFTKVTKPGTEEFEITLGFRTIREFELILKECYHDCFTNCYLCKLILLNGLGCPKCGVVVHRQCFRRYIISCKTCVSCKAPWKLEKSLVVRTRPRGEEDATPSQTQNISPTTRSGSQESSQSQVPTTSKQARMAMGASGEVDMPILERMVAPGMAGASQTRGQAKVAKKREAAGSPSKDGTPKKKSAPVKHGRVRRLISSDTDSD